MADRARLKAAADDYFTMTKVETGTGIFGLSVCSLPGRTADAIATIVGTDRLPHTWMRESTVGRLHEAGFDVVPTGWRGHATLMLPNPPTDDDWNRLEAAFDKPRDNPVARKGRNA